MSYTLAASSVEYVRAEVVSTDDPSSSTPAFSFTTADAPSSWTTAAWEGPAVLGADGLWRATARILVGPGQLTIPTGVVNVWVRVTAGPEAAVQTAGTVRVR